jgi:hypothetical protein
MMSTGAIILMILSMLVIWGGLLVSAWYLWRKPEVTKWPPGAPSESVE